jgi:hypothetical protein
MYLRSIQFFYKNMLLDTRHIALLDMFFEKKINPLSLINRNFTIIFCNYEDKNDHKYSLTVSKQFMYVSFIIVLHS